MTISGGGLPEPVTVVTGTFGYYRFENLPVGQAYVVSIESKRRFAQPSRVVVVQEDVTDFDFISEP